MKFAIELFEIRGAGETAWLDVEADSALEAAALGLAAGHRGGLGAPLRARAYEEGRRSALGNAWLAESMAEPYRRPDAEGGDHD